MSKSALLTTGTDTPLLPGGPVVQAAGLAEVFTILLTFSARSSVWVLRVGREEGFLISSLARAPLRAIAAGGNEARISATICKLV